MKKLNEGSVFTIPLRSGGFARGVIGRVGDGGVLFCYFYGPKLKTIEDACIDNSLAPHRHLLWGQCGDLGLQKGEWVLIGSISNWSRKNWILPQFLRLDEHSGKAFISSYHEDTLSLIDEHRVGIETLDLDKYPKASVMGYGFVEIKLTKILS